MFNLFKVLCIFLFSCYLSEQRSPLNDCKGDPTPKDCLCYDADFLEQKDMNDYVDVNCKLNKGYPPTLFKSQKRINTLVIDFDPTYDDYIPINYLKNLNVTNLVFKNYEGEEDLLANELKNDKNSLKVLTFFNSNLGNPSHGTDWVKLKKFQKVKSLYIDGGAEKRSIKVIDNSLGEMSPNQLEIASFTNCQVTLIDQTNFQTAFTKWTQLKFLTISGNPLNNLAWLLNPKYKYPNLVKLDLSHNQIITTGNGLGFRKENFPRLEYLFFNNNRMIHPGTYANIKAQLKELRVDKENCE